MKYKEYVTELKKICVAKNIELKKQKFGSYNFYHLVIGSGPVMCIGAGIHGDELAGPLAVLKWLKEYDSLSVRVLVLPILNPFGFDKNIRYNSRQQDINRKFCDPLVAEAKSIYELIKSYNVSFFCSLHEWKGTDGFYMYASDKNEKYYEIPKLTGFKLFEHQKVNGEVVDQGVIWHPIEGYHNIHNRCTLENKMYMDDVDYICTETPSYAKLEDRVLAQSNIINYLLDLQAAP